MHISQTKIHRAPEGSVLNSGHWFVVHDHRCKAGITMEDLLKYGYWVDVAKKFDIGHEIKVLSEDLSFRCLLLVENFQVNVGAQVAILEYVDLKEARSSSEALPPAGQGYQIVFRAARKWSILNDQGSVIKEDMSTEEEAKRELNGYLKALAA